MMNRILCSPDPAAGGGGVTHTDPPPAIPADLPSQTPPPAAHTVVHGTKSERELQLEAELVEHQKKIKGHELTLSQLQDENHRLKQPPTPPPAKKKQPSSGFAWTLLEDDDEDEDED